MANNYLLLKNDIANNFSPTSLTDAVAGSGYIATAIISSVTTKSEWAMSQWDAYLDLRLKLFSGENPIYLLTSANRASLTTNIKRGTLSEDVTSEDIYCYGSSGWHAVDAENNTVGIIASITQTQAGGTALTASMNFVETVANVNDAVTLPSVSNGASVSIINDGANTLQIFPFLGDDLGNGTNLSTHLETHEEITFWGKDSTTWHIRYTSESFHASMYEQDNTDAFVIHAVNEQHAYHSANMVEGHLGSWTYNAGSAGASITITIIADNSGSASGTILVTTNAVHGITVGDIVCHTALTDSNYVGFFTVLTVPSTTTYTVTATWGATGTGFTDRPAYLAVKDIATGFYNFEWTSTMAIVGSSIKLDFDLHDGTSTIDGSKSGYKFANTSTEKQPGGLGEKIMASGDRIFCTVKNTIDSTNIVVEHLKVRGQHI